LTFGTDAVVKVATRWSLERSGRTSATSMNRGSAAPDDAQQHPRQVQLCCELLRGLGADWSCAIPAGTCAI